MGGEASMPSINRVFLIGVVAALPVERDGVCRLVIGIPAERAGAEWLERVDVEVSGRLSDVAKELRTAEPIYAEGRLTRSPGGGVVVVAASLFAVGEPPPPPDVPDGVAGSHASPRPHDRAGHPRRIHIGTPRERVIWVQPTKVGRRGSPTG